MTTDKETGTHLVSPGTKTPTSFSSPARRQGANLSETHRSVYDASGRYSSSYLWGNNFWLGSQTQCLELEDMASYSVATLRLNITGIRLISLGICIPGQCGNPEDAATILRGALPDTAHIHKVRAVPDPNYSIWRQPAFYCILVLASVFFLLLVVGTALDLALRRRAKRRSSVYAKPVSITTLVSAEGGGECQGKQLPFSPAGRTDPDGNRHSEKSQTIGMVGQLLLCFSVWTNLLKICDTRTKESLSCVHGLRVFSLLWVIAGHTCMFAFPFSDNQNFRQLVEKDFLFQSIGNGAFSVDTFFFISGLLVCYLFLKLSSKAENRHDNDAGFMTSFMQFIGVFSYRILRLIPPYVVAMLAAQLSSTWFEHNSVLESPTRDSSNCPSFWWRNLLFLNTLFPVSDMCMIWSWYLANDTQFYALAVVLLLISVRFPKSAMVTLVVLVISSWVTTAVIVINTDHMPSVDQPLGLFDALYDKPWMRLGPYAVGMGAGLLLHRTGCKLHMHKVLVVAGWAIFFAITFTLVHGLYGELGPIESAAYVALSHTAWGGAMAWLAIACCTGHGGYINKLLSHPALYPLSRITYCAYLMHPLIMLSVLMHMDSPVHLARGTMVMMIFGYFVSAYLLSIVVSLAFEAPIIALLNLLHPIKRKLK
ncbi:nose resistant to fluoxetine protein 6 [Anabrus simplex]|uniref:nose resistant to fluoxetine protein 6 n=1 Tax=Anabrus simplex TaxID=316456 RepID=UPI0035A38F43